MRGTHSARRTARAGGTRPARAHFPRRAVVAHYFFFFFLFCFFKTVELSPATIPRATGRRRLFAPPPPRRHGTCVSGRAFALAIALPSFTSGGSRSPRNNLARSVLLPLPVLRCFVRHALASAGTVPSRPVRTHPAQMEMRGEHRG